MEPDLELVTAALGSEPRSLTPVAGGGYTRSHSWRAATESGDAFVKQAEDKGSLHMLGREAALYECVAGGFLPDFVGYATTEACAVLAVEYIHGAEWPPPYPGDVSPLFAALEEVATTPPPGGLPRVGRWRSRWSDIAAAPEPLLGLGVCSRAWLDDTLDRLVAAEAQAVWTGDELVHNDVYSGNVCFRDGRTLLVDWGVASIGSRWTDVAFAVLSVRSEGGTLPDVTLPAEGAYAAALAGHFATEAPKPLPEWAEPGSTLREDMTQDLRAALGWAAEALELPPLR